MVPKLRFPTHFTFCCFLIFFIFFCSVDGNAQCAGIAGTDETMNVCDITLPSSASVDLYAQLKGTPTPGGIWSDDDLSGGLDMPTGILNAQKITESGTYRYTYTVSNGLGCVDTAVITVHIGAYSGTSGPERSTCNDKIVNLFEIFKGVPVPSPQVNGVWVDNDNSRGLTGNFLDTSVPIPKRTYSYTYTVYSPAGSTCPASQSSTVKVAIYRNPVPGTPENLPICSDQVNLHTNLDLNSRLSGQDPGGTWSESGTNEISSKTDSFINVQNIYNTLGEGKYSFIYKVVTTDPTLCSDQRATVDIIIEKKLDFTGTKLVVSSDICENEISTATYTATLTQGPLAITDGSYDITYSISGFPAPITVTRSFIGGVATFPILSGYFQQTKDYTIRIIDIRKSYSLGLCNNIIGTIEDVLHIYPLPRINGATLTIDPVCLLDDALVKFSGSSNLSDGIYDIVYNLTNKNIANAEPAVLTVAGGLANFFIPKALIPNTGVTNIAITKITNRATGCTNTSTLNIDFNIIPLPDVSNLVIDIKDVCKGKPATVDLTGLGTLTNISINYTISGANSAPSHTIALTVAAGKTSFNIATTAIPNVGLTTFTITNVTNLLTGCSTPTSISIPPKGFTVNPLPANPVANAVQSFCSSENATVASLQPQGSQYQWFDSVTSTIPLVSTKPLVSGNYFVKEVNATTKCESGLTTITVQINLTPQINNAIATIPAICQGSNAVVNFAPGSTNLVDGDYNILYDLSDSNVKTGIAAILKVTSGKPTFTINSSDIPKAGNTTVKITNITNTTSDHCTNTSTFSQVFVVNAVPDVSNMAVAVKDGCLAQNLNVDITGLVNLTNITLSYAVSGANTIGSQTVSSVVSGGKTSFLIPGSNLLNTGNNSLVITNLTNSGNSCSSIISSAPKTFFINAIPSAPTAANQEFCETDLKTVSDLAPNGSQYKWYDTPTSTTALKRQMGQQFVNQQRPQ
jgi:hypothetical protein